MATPDRLGTERRLLAEALRDIADRRPTVVHVHPPPAVVVGRLWVRRGRFPSGGRCLDISARRAGVPGVVVTARRRKSSSLAGPRGDRRNGKAGPPFRYGVGRPCELALLRRLNHVGPTPSGTDVYGQFEPSSPPAEVVTTYHHDYSLPRVADHLDGYARAGVDDVEMVWRAFYNCLFMGRRAGADANPTTESEQE